MKKTLLYVFFIFYSVLYSQNGNVGINTINPDNSAVLDVYSINQGLLLPKVFLTNVTNSVTPVSSPTTSLLVWNTNPAVVGGAGIGVYFFNGTLWAKMKETSTLDNAYDKNGPGAGRTIIADAGAVKIEGTDGLYVSGTHATGALINSEVTGAGTRMFYSPNKSALRAGFASSNQFDNVNVGNFSGVFGANNQIFGARNFGANFNNRTSAVNASSLGANNNAYDNASITFGNTTTAGGNNSFSSGFSTNAIGYNSFVTGAGNNSSILAYSVFGTYAKNKVKTVDTYPAFNQLTDSQSSYYSSDALFAVGNGTSTSGRHNVLFVDKSGKIEINEAYKLPLVGGTTNQVIYTDGAGNLAWRNKIIDANISNLPMYADNTVYNFVNTAPNINLGNITTSINPTDFSITGAIKIKVIVRYTAQIGTQALRLVDDTGTIIVGPGQFSLYSTSVGGIAQSNWINYTNTSPVSLHLNGSNATASDSMAIEKVYLLIAQQ